MNMNKKGKEVYKYDKIYNHEGYLTKKGVTKTWEEADDNFKKKWKKYGHSFEGKNYTRDVINLQPKSIIDIGCGWNEFCKTMKSAGISNCIGVDCSCPGADIIASAHDIPVQDKSYDLLVSFDCMEHIPKEEVLDSFKEFARICNRMFIKVALTENTTFIDGEILHTCVESIEWWLKQAENYFNIKSQEVKTPNPAHSHVLIYGDVK